MVSSRVTRPHGLASFRRQVGVRDKDKCLCVSVPPIQQFNQCERGTHQEDVRMVMSDGVIIRHECATPRPPVVRVDP